MTKKVRHLIGISGGKDSAALAIYLKLNYPELNIDYYFCDTGKELDETYELIDELETFLGQKITRLEAAQNSPEDPFDHYLKEYKGFLPSSMARWCTKKLKLQPFEQYVGDDPVVSYVAIRGDEDREGYVSTKPNIQTVFPFRKNIWSVEVLNKVLHNNNIDTLTHIYKQKAQSSKFEQLKQIIEKPQGKSYKFSQKLNDLLDIDTKLFNHVVFEFIQSQNYPLTGITAEEFPLLNNDYILGIDDVFQLFYDNGVKVPGYYEEIEFEVDGEVGKYNRTRSGCYFCFYQRKIEWIWLYERHPDLFKKAMEYEKDGYTWMQDESLSDIIQPERMKQIKREHLEKIKNKLDPKSNKLIDILDDDSINCVNCFV